MQKLENSNSDPIYQTGQILLHLALEQAKADNPKNPYHINIKYRDKLIAESRRNLERAHPKSDYLRYAVVKIALESIEANARGDNILGGIEVFRGFVETINGGYRDLDFGGKKVNLKPAAHQAYLRAAFIVLWTEYPKNRNHLITKARSLLNIRTKQALAKLVDNFHQKHDIYDESKSPISIHIPIVTDLIRNHGYNCLKDFT
jgi:hypothetical protein|tara:strand:- start:569 stop:1177 length:609 start_codon:yes stop_codon:yes gene_type:complete